MILIFRNDQFRGETGMFRQKRLAGMFFITLIILSLSGVSMVISDEGSTSTAVKEASPAGILDGKTFVVWRGLEGHEATAQDEIRFFEGKFFSVLCSRYGFRKGTYRATVEGDTISYEVETTSPKHGTIVWEGKITGEEIESIYTWTEKGWFRTKVRKYWHKGTLKK